jgi:hypothetical protein
MINFIILNRATSATIMWNLDIHTPININTDSVNNTISLTKMRIRSCHTYRSVVDAVVIDMVVTLLTTTSVKMSRSRGRWRWWTNLDGRWPIMKTVKSCVERFQNPNWPFPIQDHKVDRFQRHALSFADARRRVGWSRLRWWYKQIEVAKS